MKKIIKEWRKASIYLFLILLVGLTLRTYNLNELPIFGDEAIYIRWAQIMRNEPTLRFIPLTDGKQPLFMWIVIPFQKLFTDPLIAGRMVSVSTGMVSLIGIFVLTHLLFNNKKVSLVASTIYAMSPFAVFFDRLALADSMLAMFGIWTFIFSYSAIKNLRFDFAMLAGFALGGAFLTKSPALFFLLLIPTTILFVKLPEGKNKKVLHFIKLAFLWGTTSVIGFAMYNIQRLGPNFHMLSTRTKDYVYPISHLWESPLDPFLPFFDRSLEYVWILGPSFLFALFIISIIVGYKKHAREFFVLGAWLLGPIVAVSALSKTMTARYIFFSVPYFFVISALAFDSKKNIINKIVNIVFIIFIVQSFVFNHTLLTNINAANLPRSERSGFLEEWTSGTGIKEVSEYIREYHAKNPEENIIVGTEGFFGPLPDGLQAYLADSPEITVIGVGTELVEIPESLVESKEFGNTTFLVINDSRLDKDPEKLGLKLLAAYPKALRPDFVPEYKHLGPKEVLYLFEVR